MQNKVWLLVAVFIKAHLVKQSGGKPRAFDGAQELLRDNHIRIDIDKPKWRRG